MWERYMSDHGAGVNGSNVQSQDANGDFFRSALPASSFVH